MAKIHKVKKGETLSDIANKYGVTVNAIQKANSSIKDINKIYVDQLLTIPNGSKDYEEIGTQFERALKDVQNLPSVKKLVELLGE